MKHKNSQLSSASLDFFNHKINSLYGITLEFFIYFCYQQKKPCCFVVDRATIEAISIVFQNSIGDDVGCLLKKDLTGSLNENFYNNISNVSRQALAANKNISLFFKILCLFMLILWIKAGWTTREQKHTF